MPSIAEQFGINTDQMSNEEIDVFVNGYRVYSELKEKAELKAQEEFYLKKERMRIQLGLNKSIPTFEMEEFENLQEKIKEKKKENDPKFGCFITVNPSENTLAGFEKLKEKVDKCLSKVWVTDYAYCYEQRSTNPENIFGLHVHILLKRGIRPKHTEREVQNTFKSICGNLRHVDIQYKRKEWFNDKIEYMRGKKTGEGKLEKVEVDRVMRDYLGIDEIYSSENFFLNYSTNAENQRSEG